MSGQLVFLDEGWELRDADDVVVDSGGYPVRESAEFIEAAAEALDVQGFHLKPYDRVDRRYD